MDCPLFRIFDALVKQAPYLRHTDVVPPRLIDGFPPVVLLAGRVPSCCASASNACFIDGSLNLRAWGYIHRRDVPPHRLQGACRCPSSSRTPAWRRRSSSTPSRSPTRLEDFGWTPSPSRVSLEHHTRETAATAAAGFSAQEREHEQRDQELEPLPGRRLAPTLPLAPSKTRPAAMARCVGCCDRRKESRLASLLLVGRCNPGASNERSRLDVVRYAV